MSTNDPILDDLITVNFKAGDILFSEGEPGFFFYILQEGKVEVFKNMKGGKKVLGVVDSGQPIGEFALITQSVRSASARALSDGFAIKVSEKAYQKLLNELPDWALAVMQSLIKRLKEANEFIIYVNENTQTQTSTNFDDITQKINF